MTADEIRALLAEVDELRATAATKPACTCCASPSPVVVDQRRALADQLERRAQTEALLLDRDPPPPRSAA